MCCCYVFRAGDAAFSSSYSLDDAPCVVTTWVSFALISATASDILPCLKLFQEASKHVSLSGSTVSICKRSGLREAFTFWMGLGDLPY